MFTYFYCATIRPRARRTARTSPMPMPAPITYSLYCASEFRFRALSSFGRALSRVTRYRRSGMGSGFVFARRSTRCVRGLPRGSLSIYLSIYFVAADFAVVSAGCELSSAARSVGLPYRHTARSFLAFQRNMCQDNVNLPKEANKARCFVISCFVLCASPGAHAAPPKNERRPEAAVRLPAVMQQLHHLTQCACTAFSSRTVHTCAAAPSSRSSASLLVWRERLARSVGSSHASARASFCAARQRLPGRMALAESS
jgi:hypothetical protein